MPNAKSVQHQTTQLIVKLLEQPHDAFASEWHFDSKLVYMARGESIRMYDQSLEKASPAPTVSAT